MAPIVFTFYYLCWTEPQFNPTFEKYFQKINSEHITSLLAIHKLKVSSLTCQLKHLSKLKMSVNYNINPS